jgi:hypothetical protein
VRILSSRILPLATALLLLARPATGQFVRDEAAKRKIREAIDSHYLATDFDKAEQVLSGTITACGDKCSPQLLARAWMYVGIVRGTGKNDAAGAKEAFVRALQLDPAVELDAAVATDATHKIFQDAGGAIVERAIAPDAPAADETKPQVPPVAAAEITALECTPKGVEVETRRSIPVECRSQEGAASLELRFQPFGEDWQSLAMVRKGESFRAEIPCDKTTVSGTLRLFVRARDASGDELAAWGTKAAPRELRIVETSREEPPSFEDSDPPPRCSAKEDCPPNFPGCGAGEQGPSDEAASRFSKNWLGLHVAQDLAFVGGSDVCTQESQATEDFACYYAGSRSGAYVDEPYPGTESSTSLVLATTRILVSYDRALSANLLAGVRVGYALGGGPPSGRDVVYDSSGRVVDVVAEGLSFLPYHAEARASYWFGAGALSRVGFRPYVHLGGGLAQVDANLVVSVEDCGLVAPREDPAYAECASGRMPANDPRLRTVELDAWKKLGQGFVTIGGGTAYAFTRDLGAQLNLNLLYMLPGSGVVVEPSLGAILGF